MEGGGGGGAAAKCDNGVVFLGRPPPPLTPPPLPPPTELNTECDHCRGRAAEEPSGSAAPTRYCRGGQRDGKRHFTQNSMQFHQMSRQFNWKFPDLNQITH